MMATRLHGKGEREIVRRGCPEKGSLFGFDTTAKNQGGYAHRYMKHMLIKLSNDPGDIQIE
jgi:hypothetical protein